MSDQGEDEIDGEEPADDDLTFVAVDHEGNPLGEIDLSSVRPAVEVYAARFGLTPREAAQALMQNLNLNCELYPDDMERLMRQVAEEMERGEREDSGDNRAP